MSTRKVARGPAGGASSSNASAMSSPQSLSSWLLRTRASGKHRVVTLRGGLERALDPAPRHHHRGGREARLEDFVPADEAPAARLEEARDALREMHLQARRVAGSEAAQEGAPALRFEPLSLL